MTTHKFKRRLTDDEMDRITSAVTDATTPTEALVAAIRGFFDIGLQETEGCGWADVVSREAKVNGSEYAIPEDQWHALGEHLLRRGDQLSSSLTTINLLLDWMNLGPSSYAEPEVVA